MRKHRKRLNMGLLILTGAAILLTSAAAMRLPAITDSRADAAGYSSSSENPQGTFHLSEGAYYADGTLDGETAGRAAFGSGSVAADDWNLTLVNPWNSMTADYEPALTQLRNGQAVDERCYPELQLMMDDCRAAGLSPLICSSYRTWQEQERLFNNKVRNLIRQGLSREEACAEAGKAVAVPGTSEHQLGLAVDIVDINNQNLDISQENTDVQQWMMENSWQYGFILRYPADKSDITGIDYEPWHYRYVGKEAAQYIYENEICLEEYLD